MKTKKEIEEQIKRDKALYENATNRHGQLVSILRGWIDALEWVLEGSD